MSSDANKNGPFDVKTVEALVALMSQHDLSEIYLRDGAQHVRLRRGGLAVPTTAALPYAPTLQSAPPSAASEPRKEAAASKKHLTEVKSEMIGTFYTQAKPGEPPYVKVGDRIIPSKVIGLIEVMKTYNEVLANCSGVVVEVAVENGAFVEFGTVLIRVDPS